jgi:hypothetical protein
MPLIPALRRQRQVDFWVWGKPGLQSEFQYSQGYTEKPCLKKQNKTKQNKTKKEFVHLAWDAFVSKQPNLPSWLIQSSSSWFVTELICFTSFYFGQYIIIFWFHLILCLVVSSLVYSLFPLWFVSVKLSQWNCRTSTPHIFLSLSLLLHSLLSYSLMSWPHGISDSFCQIFHWFITLSFFFFFFPFFIRYLTHLHFQCYTKSPPYPPSPTPLPTHSPFLALVFPCTGAYKVCKSNGPLFPVMAD